MLTNIMFINSFVPNWSSIVSKFWDASPGHQLASKLKTNAQSDSYQNLSNGWRKMLFKDVCNVIEVDVRSWGGWLDLRIYQIRHHNCIRKFTNSKSATLCDCCLMDTNRQTAHYKICIAINTADIKSLTRCCMDTKRKTAHFTRLANCWTLFSS